MSTKVEFTNRSKPALYLKDYDYNFQTPITMFGRYIEDYDAVVWSNLLHRLENWSNSEAPANAVEGQLWFDSKNVQLMVNIGKDMSSPNWRAVSRGLINTTGLLQLTGGTLYSDLYLSGEITHSEQVATRAYAAQANSIALHSKNDNYQYNMMDYNGFITFNGCVVADRFENNSYTVTIPQTMSNTSYIVTLSLSSNTGAAAINYDYTFHVIDRQVKTFKIVTDTKLPVDSEVNFSVVGFTQL